MNCYLDISAIPYGTGVSRYTSNLATALSKEIQNEITFFGTAFRLYPQLRQYSGRIYPFPPSFTTKLFHEFNVPIDCFTPGADVFHTWDWYLPVSKKIKTVITIHDLALFKYPNIAHPEIKAHHQAVLERIKKFKPQIIAVSQTTKNDLIDLFNIDPNDITVVYEALPEEFKQVTPTTVNGISKPYFLMVGTLEPRKNYPRQIEAWQKYKQDYDLIIVGKDGWEEVKEEEGIIRKKYVSPQELAGLYTRATLLMYCSLAEGFGLPILEANHYGIPVITSNCSSMEEIASGQQGILLADPNNVDSIRHQIDVLLSTSDIKENIVATNQYLSTKFTWDKAAKETIEVYRKAIG